jgi:hypothetical protein
MSNSRLSNCALQQTQHIYPCHVAQAKEAIQLAVRLYREHAKAGGANAAGSSTAAPSMPKGMSRSTGLAARF